MVKVEVISREIIKPSSPTPLHLKTCKLSFIDQFIPPNIQVPIFLFYPATPPADGNDNHVERSDRLKKSLSKTLTHFYPFVGTINDNLTVQCDDYGVDYLETRVNCQLSEVLTHPEAHIIQQLCPYDYLYCGEFGSKGRVLLAIQINLFECGGMAICASVVHKIADAASLSTFLDAWARTARGGTNCEELMSPSFDVAGSLFPPKEAFKSLPLVTNINSKEKYVSKRFVFDATKIAALKAKVTADHDLHVENPTRVETVSALIWKCASKVGSSKSGSNKPCSVIVAVNFRSRMVPPLPKYSMGNLITGAMAKMTNSELELHYLVGNLRDAIRKIDGDYVRGLQIDGFNQLFLREMREAHEQFNEGEIELYTISSWCRFPFYEADFGWGNPIWVCTVNLCAKNVVMLMDTRSGDGVEAWVTLDDHVMAEFESDHELREFISTNNLMAD